MGRFKLTLPWAGTTVIGQVLLMLDAAGVSEIVVVTGHRLDFGTLQSRIHPADSRVQMLAREVPASFVAFDLLALGDHALLHERFDVRRAMLEAALADAEAPIHLTPTTTDRDQARDWFVRFEGAGLDGVIAKQPDAAYQPDKRVQLKVKHKRTADCVVAGFRVHKSGDGPGSLVLGLYDEDGSLHHIGVASSFSAALRAQLVDDLAPYLDHALDDHPWREWVATELQDTTQGPGGGSRWNAGKDLSFTPLRPELVVEVRYDHMEGVRFRHTAQFVRWRPDRDPGSCTYAQLEEPVSYDLAEVLRAR